jgi:GT2 family glycosyltransferase
VSPLTANPQTPSVLVGIVTRNRAAIVAKAVQSALEQRDCRVRVEVIDNASTDGTPQLATQFPDVTWTRWPANRGYMAARNLWMSSTPEDYFVSLDDDAWFLTGDEIAIAVDALEQNPNVAAVAFDILSPDRPDVAPRRSAQPAALFIGCGHVLRLSAVRKVGVYEDSPGLYGGEERDLCLRLMDAGYQVLLLPGVHVWHDKTPVAREVIGQFRSLVSNDLALALRRVPSALLAPTLVSRIIRHGASAWKNRMLRYYVEALGMFLRSVPSVWHSRRPVKVETFRAYRRLA